tara:strand:+ start:4820 stop:5023 length:204 start_codon:yes stop_codon:yes gene_type:complete
MKNKFSDNDLMKFADGELHDNKKAMDILSVLVEETLESIELKKRLAVYTETRNALFSGLIDLHRRKQ